MARYKLTAARKRALRKAQLKSAARRRGIPTNYSKKARQARKSYRRRARKKAWAGPKTPKQIAILTARVAVPVTIIGVSGLVTARNTRTIYMNLKHPEYMRHKKMMDKNIRILNNNKGPKRRRRKRKGK